jgi:hypothetical protein
MAAIKHKRGDSFELACTLENEGVAVNITNITITSQARGDDDALLQQMTVTKTNSANGEFAVSATATQTESWGVGTYDCDIEFQESSGEINSSQTFQISVIKDITRD